MEGDNDQLVEVTWKDAHGHHNWIPKKAIKYEIPIRIRTYGILAYKDDEKIIIAGSTDNSSPPDGVYGNVTIIPASWVSNIRILIFKKE